MWNEGTRIHFQTIMTILPLTDRRSEFSVDGSRLVSEVDFGSQSISGRPAESRGGRRRSGRESSLHRSLHASPLETSPSWTRGRGGRVDGGADIQRQTEVVRGDDREETCNHKQAASGFCLLLHFVLNYCI